jgi:hypothetical protein
LLKNIKREGRVRTSTLNSLDPVVAAVLASARARSLERFVPRLKSLEARPPISGPLALGNAQLLPVPGGTWNVRRRQLRAYAPLSIASRRLAVGLTSSLVLGLGGRLLGAFRALLVVFGGVCLGAGVVSGYG